MPAKKEEKRASSRFGCSGEAQMQIPAEQFSTQGEVLDLSLEGCRVEFLAPQQLELEESVELLFSVNMLPFHLLAVVKSRRSYREFGFQFPPMLDRKREQLQELIEELKHPRPKTPPSNILPFRGYRIR